MILTSPSAECGARIVCLAMPHESQPVAYSRRMVLRILDLLIGIVEFLLGLRILLRLLGASESGFTAWLYSLTDQLLAPFFGIFPSYALSGGYVVEFSTLFAMFAYAILGWLIIRLVWFITDTLLRFDAPVVD